MQYISTPISMENIYEHVKNVSVSRSLYHVLVFIVLHFCLVVTYAEPVNYLVASFSESNSINHVTVNVNTGKVYVGAVNKLYQLSENLVQEKSAATGPKEDSPNCRPNSTCEDYEKISTNSISKALVIDYDDLKILTCSNTMQGHCEKRKLSDITQKDPDLWVPMVPFDEVSPVVIYIAGGPVPTGSGESCGTGKKVLYIGATRSTNGETSFRDTIPSLASRRLDNFKITNENLVGGKTFLNVADALRDIYIVNYKYGFPSETFSYFLAVQKKELHNVEGALVTKISRVCHNDCNFYSYVEMDMRCSDYTILRAAYVTRPGSTLARNLEVAHEGQTHLDDVLFAVFGKEKDDAAGSALCMYKLRDIRSKFTASIAECFKGQGNFGPDYMGKNGACITTSMEIDDDYCGEFDFNTPISRGYIEENPVVTFSDDLVTGITVTTTSDYTVAFVGTTEGLLKKVVIESKDRAIDYETVIVSSTGEEINPDLTLDRSQAHIYVATDTEIQKLKVQDCSQYTSCSSCLGANDPYCGWCSLESKCSVHTECPEASLSLRWLSYMRENCTQILEIFPDKAQIRREPYKLQLTVQNLPNPMKGDYQCVFTGTQSSGMTPRTTPATKIGNSNTEGRSTLECETPEHNLLPDFSTKDHIKLDVSIRMDGKDFVSRAFTFFDCEVHSSCTSCTESDFPCTWCVQRHTCTHNRESCGTDILVTGTNVQGMTDRPGPENCPRIEAIPNEILVPSSQQKKVIVTAVNLHSFQQNFQCEFDLETGKHVVNAQLKQMTSIECEAVKFEYRSSTISTLNVPFSITWTGGQNNERNALDNPQNIQVKVYKCEAMADNCGVCLTMDNKYNCGWCRGQSSCQLESQCLPDQDWLNHSKVCPDPVITMFYPNSGPWEGGTLVTIEGKNLGKAYDDIRTGINVAGVPCEAVADNFKAATRVSCKTGKTTNVESGTVQVTISNKYTTESQQIFTYVKPNITKLHPLRGPQSGGTRLTITGNHLNVGTSVTAFLLNRTCRILRKDATIAICETPASPEVDQGNLSMQIDDSIILYKGPQFFYVADPIIQDVSQKKGIVSGGLMAKVEGLRLDLIQEPQMVVYYRDGKYTSDCTVIYGEEPLEASYMNCPTPALPNIFESVPPPVENNVRLDYGFIMDNVTALLNWSGVMATHYNVFPDPDFEKFEGGVKTFQSGSDFLILSGDHLDHALTKEDIQVKVGEAECMTSSLSTTQLSCEPPSPDDTGVGRNPRVMVIIGRNWTVELGTLKYEGQQTLFAKPLIIGISVVGVLLTLFIVAIIVLYRGKSKESGRVMKRMQHQMDALEAKVAKECKEAFAELQTDMTEITSDLAGHMGIPFRDYRSFSMKVLFPNTPEDEHPVVRGSEVDYLSKESLEKGLSSFNKLIGNKTFLLLFIRTLEQNQEFTMKERVNVASLISVALQNRMEYHTDILKTLLAELIETEMESHHHPKLLLRRTQSVAEKMLTNWFTFLLHKFLLECAGEPLFLLFRAIKQQVDKGPVDALTSEAKYALSEDKLIRQQIEYKQLTLRVRDLDQGQGYGPPQQEHYVKVLDCDTISQVKEKILDALYKNKPFSRRPEKEELDLEWHTGVKGRLILKDEDHTMKADGEYKKLNTLAHYAVLDQAVVALVLKQTSMYNLNSITSSDRSGSQSHFYTHPGNYGGSPSLSRSASPHSPHTVTLDIDQARSKSYHLVKPSESEGSQREGDRGNKMVSEIYLTRLLATKGTLQQFVDDLFETLFSTAARNSVLPLAIKYMFDFLDDQALHHGITDPEVVHTWKSNSLPLRFWVNVVKNPNFVFDVHKSNIVDSCLTVVGQTFMDSCSMSEHRLGKDSPSSKLLYAKDIPKYKKWVERYYQDIKQMPAISDQDMNAMLAEESRQHCRDFNLNAALYELYRYTVTYNEQLMMSLDEDEFARSYRLASRLDQVHMNMETQV